MTSRERTFRILVFVSIAVLLPTPFYAIAIGGFMPAIWFLVGPIYAPDVGIICFVHAAVFFPPYYFVSKKAARNAIQYRWPNAFLAGLLVSLFIMGNLPVMGVAHNRYAGHSAFDLIRVGWNLDALKQIIR